jgi:branched-chain amino acid transport system substrate-binding protein
LKDGAEAAIADINAKGGVNGEQFVLKIGDDQCEARRAIALANEFASSDVRMVVGHFCSGAAIAAAKVYAERDVLMIAPSASHPKLTESGFETTIRLASRDDSQGEIAARRILAANPNATVAVIDDGLPLSKLTVGRFAAIKAPALSFTIKPGEKAFDGIVSELVAKGITDVYFACGGIEAGIMTSAYRQAGGQAKFYGADGLLVDSYWERAGVAGEGTLAAFPDDPMTSPYARELVARFAASDKVADGAVVPSYAAVQLFVQAIGKNSTGKARDLAQWIKSGKDIDTVLGPLTFDQKGDVNPQHFIWYKWSAGKFAAE